MFRVLQRARKRFRRDQRGNIAILSAFTAIPLIGLVSGAVDMTRQAHYKVKVANAMDAAAIALVRSGIDDDAEADQFVNTFIGTMVPSNSADPMLHLNPFDAIKIPGGYRVKSDGFLETAFMPVVGISTLRLDLTSEVVMSTGDYEVALALDNTGSMARFGRIEALREAAGQLVDDLYREPGTEDRVKMALVPFVTAVNIKTPGVFQSNWIDPTGANQGVFGFNFERPANRLTLFDQMGVPWAGCVEARAAPDDEDDTAPTSAATRWVPYLWPDEPDRGYGNNYITQRGGGSDLDLLRDVDKYAVPRGTRVPNTASLGPNAACPRPIVELTNDTQRMHDEIERMRPHNTSGGNNSGTNVAQGLMWGWSVLSPEEPFSQGVAYNDDETTKVLVLLSDGRNQIVDNNDVTESDYTSYGYLAANRLGSRNNYLVAERTVDAKVSRICQNIKDQGIRIYTILFQVDFDETQEIFRQCASVSGNGTPLYYYVPDASQLITAFNEIGKDLTSLRVSR